MTCGTEREVCGQGRLTVLLEEQGMMTLKKLILVTAVLSMTTFTAVSCGKKESQTPAAGTDTTMVEVAPDTTGAAAATDTTKTE